tara:strand:+ start:2320 stop:3312 length:993 start_codon:yes stop_codon:yes gene_type:complete
MYKKYIMAKHTQKRKQKQKQIKHNVKNKTFKLPTIEINENSKCAPLVDGKTPVKGSCLTMDSLLLLKESYNKQYQNSKILSVEPVQIWNDMKLRMKNCTKEDCWLNVLTDSKLQTKLNKYLFRPKKSERMSSRKRGWLSSRDIRDVLQQYEHTYPTFKLLGPTAIDFDFKPSAYGGSCVDDELCLFQISKHIEEGKTKFGMVFNLDKHTGPGTHWTSLFLDIQDKFIFYFDSNADDTPNEIKTLIQRIKQQCMKLSQPIKLKTYFNGLEHQLVDGECGIYALFFNITMLTNKVGTEYFSNPLEKINLFLKQRISDDYMSSFRNIYFNDIS